MSPESVEEQIGTISFERRAAVQYAADLETIRINRWRMIRIHEKKMKVSDTTSETLDSEPVPPGEIWVIKNIVAHQVDNKPDHYALGFYSAHHFQLLSHEIPANDKDSAIYVGQVILHEGDKVRVVFEGPEENDTIHLYANGYMIKR